MAWRHQRDHGQLRCWHRTLPRRDARDRHAGSGQRGKHFLRRPQGRRDLGLGDLSTVPRIRRSPRISNQSGLLRAAHAVSTLRHGRSIDGPGRDWRGDGGYRPLAGGGDGGGRIRVFDQHAQPAHRLRRPASRMPARKPRRTRPVRTGVAHGGARRHRGGAVAEALVPVGPGVRDARVPGRSKRPARDVAFRVPA